MIQALRRDAQQPVQFLLFSATFNEKVKGFALKVVADNGREEANQVIHCALTNLLLNPMQQSGSDEWS